MGGMDGWEQTESGQWLFKGNLNQRGVGPGGQTWSMGGDPAPKKGDSGPAPAPAPTPAPAPVPAPAPSPAAPVPSAPIAALQNATAAPSHSFDAINGPGASPLRQDLGYRTPASIQALLQGLRY